METCDSEQEVKEKNVWKWLLFCVSVYLRERAKSLVRKNCLWAWVADYYYAKIYVPI